MSKLFKVSNYDQIVAYLKDPEAETSLTDHQQQLLNRWNEAFTLLRNYHSTSDAAAILMKRFPGLSRATAYRDCGNAQSLFGDISQSTKQGIKHLATEIVRDAINIARTKNNEVAMINGADKIASINGVNTVDPDIPDFSKLEPNTYVIGLPDNAVKVLQNMLKGGAINLGDMVTQMGNQAAEAEIVEDHEAD